MTNRSGTLYTGVTSNLMRRILEHRAGRAGSFTSRYRITQLVYFEETNDIRAALEREKQIKGWSRKKRIDLINSSNPRWQDLSEGWFDDEKTASVH